MSMTFPPGSEQSRNQLIESHLPLVRSIAKRHAGRGEALEDLVQVGCIGLIRASARFDPDRGAAFATFAAPAIEGEIRRHLDDRATALRVPRELQRITSELQRRRADLTASLGRPPTVTELAAALELEVSEVERALDAERALQPGPAQADEMAEMKSESQPLASSEDRLLVAAGAHVLDERERRIVLLRFHADLTEQEIARDLGISQAHVSRLLSAALAKLRTELTSENASQSASNRDQAAPEALSRSPGNGRMASDEKKRQKDSRRPQTETKIDAVDARAKEPTKKSGHSGRFLVRMPSALHGKLTAAAESEQVSLNRFVTDALTAAVSKEHGDSSPHGAIQPDSASHSPPVAGRSSRAELGPEANPDEAHSRRFRMLLAANIVVIVVAAVVAAVLLVLALERGI